MNSSSRKKCRFGTEFTFAVRLCGSPLGEVVVSATGFALLVFLLAPHRFLVARGSASCTRAAYDRFEEPRAGATASGEPLDVLGNRSPNGRRAPTEL